MKDVLAVPHRPLRVMRAVVCPDECGKRLIGEVRSPLPRPARDDRPGRTECRDREYARHGTANLFMTFRRVARGGGHRPASA